MNDRAKRIGMLLAAAVTITAIITVLAINHHNRQTTATGTATTTSETTRTQKKTTQTLSDTERQQLANLAVDFERKARTWGVDPLKNAEDWAKRPAGEVQAELRTPGMGDNPLAGIADPSLYADTGPAARSKPCRNDVIASCTLHPTSYDWWTSETWGIGTAWLTEPTATVINSNTVRVTGIVRSILVTGTDTFSLGQWHAITPVWETRQVDDLLTIENGKITGVEYDKTTPWWTNPWLSDWTASIIDNMNSGTRVAIPVDGATSMDLSHTSLAGTPSSPKTMGDENVDWSLWNGLATTGDSPQQPDGLDPERDAATVKDRL